jgi:acyl dehydratase
VGRYLEDFTLGEEIVSYGQTLTTDGIIAFATLYDPQAFHIDAEAAAASPYGGLIASGFQTLAIAFRMFLDTGVVAGTSLGSPGCDELRWLRPVRPGDTLRTVVRIDALRPSSSKPDRGLVTTFFRVLNQRDEEVATLKGILLVKRRPAAPAS